MKDNYYNSLNKKILNEVFNSINEEISNFKRRKAIMESFGYEFDTDKLPKLTEKWAKDIREKVNSITNSVKTQKDKLGMFDVVEFKKRDKYVVIRILGGLNGPGEWTNYMASITKLINKITEEYKRTWVVQLVNDCIDDVFTLDIGIGIQKEDKK